MTTYYLNQNLTTGANDGSSEANAFQSFAAMSAGVGAGTHTVEFVEGSGPYYLASSWAMEGNNHTYNYNNNVISAGIDCNNSAYKWTASANGTNEYYLELAAGGDPSISDFTASGVAVVDGNFYEWSPEKSIHAFGTAGSLNDLEIDYADNDTLGYSTVYVRSANPDNIEIKISNLTFCIASNFTGTTHNNGIFELASTSAIRNYGSSSTMTINQCTFRYCDTNAISHEGAGDMVIKNCLGYHFGHRFVQQSTVNCEGTTSVYNCVAVYGHLFAVLNSTDATPPTMNIYGCIAVGQSNGAIDKKDADATLNENNNCWYPAFDSDSGTKALGYVSTANWGTTGANDIPPSAATTIGTVANNEAAGAADPLLTNYVIDSFASLDTDLQAGSPCIGAGYKWWTGPNPVGSNGEPFSDFDTDMGANQSKHGPFHPVNL